MSKLFKETNNPAHKLKPARKGFITVAQGYTYVKEGLILATCGTVLWKSLSGGSSSGSVIGSEDE